MAARGKDLRSQLVPQDAAWGDLHLTVGETALKMRINESSRELSVEDLGFADKRKGDVAGDKVWQILRMFAREGGTLAVSEIAAKDSERQPFQKQIRILRQRLQTVFPIQGDPIRCDRAQERYQCAFQIGRLVESGLALGQNTSWLEVRIAELRDGRIQFQVKGKKSSQPGGTESSMAANGRPPSGLSRPYGNIP